MAVGDHCGRWQLSASTTFALIVASLKGLVDSFAYLGYRRVAGLELGGDAVDGDDSPRVEFVCQGDEFFESPVGAWLVLSSGMTRCRVARRASWAASGAGRRARAGFELCLVDDPRFWSGYRNRPPRFGSRVRGCCRSGRGTGTVWGSALEVFVESAAAVLIEAQVAAGALMPAVA